MRVTIHPSELYGTIQAPASKSYAQRALAAALLANGFTVLRNPSRCDDAVSAMKVIQALGADISDHGDQLKIRGGFSPVSTNLNFGEAGLGIRLFASIAALHTGEITLSGSGSLTKRPMGLIHEALSTLGVNCKTNNGFLPIKVNGPLNGGNIKIDGSLSSQVLTGLLMALPLAKNDSVIEVHNLQSIPYIDMTLQLMKDFGIIVSHNNYQEFCIPGQQRYIATDYLIEGDWSGGAFLLVAGAISGRVKIEHLKTESLQADREIMRALKEAGAQIEVHNGVIQSSKSELKAFSFDATHCPDLFPPLVALAAHCKGRSQIKGVGRLIHKESNRADALLNEMGKLGVRISITDDYMYIEGSAKIKAASIHSHHDHRIAMAAATVVMGGNEAVSIEAAECINKSYPDFYNDLTKLGGKADEPSMTKGKIL